MTWGDRERSCEDKRRMVGKERQRKKTGRKKITRKAASCEQLRTCRFAARQVEIAAAVQQQCSFPHLLKGVVKESVFE